MKVLDREVLLKNGKKVLLRSAMPVDAEKMLIHLRTTHTESYRNLNQSANYWSTVSIADEQKILSDFESAKNRFMLVAVYGEKIVGGLGFFGNQAEFTKHTAQIGMSIQQEFANSGLGTEMLKYTIMLAKEFAFHRIELTVRTYNAQGITLNEKVGFQRVGLLKDAAFIDGKFVDEFSYQLVFK